MAWKVCSVIQIILTVMVMCLLINSTYIFGRTFRACLSNEPLLKVFGISFRACLQIGKCANDCGHVLYVRKPKECQLHPEVVEFKGQFCPGNVLESVLQGGIYNPIIEDDNCTIVQHCSVLVVGENATMLGNKQEIGTKRKLTCKPSFSVLGPRTIICNTSGHWSRRGECVKTCVIPAALTYMEYEQVIVVDEEKTVSYIYFDKTYVQLFEHSSIRIGCLNGTTLVGPSSITCIDGQWTGFPICTNTTMRLPCEQNTDCIETFSECRHGACWCQPELSYYPLNQTCISGCQEYGDTFQVVRGMNIPLLDIYFTQLDSIEDCMTLCLTFRSSDHPRYTCKHAEFGIKHRYCYLTADLMTLSDVIQETQASTYSLFRDCA